MFSFITDLFGIENNLVAFITFIFKIQSYLRLLSRKYPKKIRVETIGQTIQGRDIDMIILRNNICVNNKYATFIDANIHAREWLSNSTILYFIDYLTRNQKILNDMDFYIVPCLNPDGYEYTHTVNRLWRKNLNCNGDYSVNKYGVDLNRNFPYGFGLKGSSKLHESFMYRGTHALSEPESKALAFALRKYRDYIKLYISLHCYGNVILFPWGFTKDCIRDRALLEECANNAKQIMKLFKDRKFKVGSSASKMYITSGSTIDYAKGALKIKFCYTIELQKCGKSGFTPSTKRIVEVGEETACGIVEMVKFVKKYYRKRNKKYEVCERFR